MRQDGGHALPKYSKGSKALPGTKPKVSPPQRIKPRHPGKKNWQSYSLTIKLMLLLRKFSIVVVFFLPRFPFSFG